MAKQSKKKRTPKDINQLAAFIVEQTTKESDNKTQMSPNEKKPLGTK